ncbi:MAG: lipopolysaccharide biosynthesis protein [Methylicorpusculum sp.]|uniref:GumC family protein n=1 Tax=Methylicorpusculum sp. TaxID=2713644 RepID=UPI002731EB5B|nr:lipopolysaccharide biosynthesis protein [Methylicorpusculum sp.]MDP2180332.1 lipopolysaccharide biosynthesis protein [Methylicorpusculum sp.]
MEEENTKGLQDYVAMFKRQRGKLLLIASGLFLLTIIVAISLPSVYKATATILIEQQEIPPDLVRSTVTSYADQRIQVISQRVMTSSNLKRIIDKFGLYEDEQKANPLSVVLETMKEDIQLEMVSADVVDPVSGRPTQATIAFTLAFSSKYPKIAQEVANELVSLYLDENLKRRSEVAAETTSFLGLEASKLSEQIANLETELAIFKEKNANSLPQLQNFNMQLMDKTEQQIIEVDRQINALNERKIYLDSQLSSLSPHTTIYSATGERIYGSEDRLKALEAEFISLSARYSGNHPDITKTKREIEALRKEVGTTDNGELLTQLTSKRADLATLIDRYSESHPDVKKLRKEISNLEAQLNRPLSVSLPKSTAKPDNPAYIQLKAQLEAAESELRAQRTSKESLRQKLSDYEKSILQAPQVEREFQSLMRDYENATIKYREVKAKQMEADMAQAMEKDRKGERFSLIEPPMFPEEPFKPNRKAIIFLGLILSIGSSFGFAVVKESLSSAIFGSRSVLAVTGLAPLVVLPYIETDEDISKNKSAKLKVVLSIIGALIAAILFFHFVIKPLDVLWYVVMRKLGLG